MASRDDAEETPSPIRPDAMKVLDLQFIPLEPAARPSAWGQADRGVELIAVGGGGPMLAALDNDQIAAGMFLDPLLTQLLAQPDRYQVVHDFRNLEYPLLCVGLRRDWLKGNEASTRDFLAALVAAEAELQADPSVALTVARDKFADVEPSVLEAAVTNTLPRLSKDGRISEQAHQNVLDQQLFAGTITTPIAYQQAVDLGYLPV